MSLESKLAEARRHLSLVRLAEAKKREEAERQEANRTRARWGSLLMAAETLLGRELVVLLPATPDGAQDTCYSRPFNGGTRDAEIPLTLPNGGEVHVAFGWDQNEERWVLFRTPGRPLPFRVPQFTIVRDEDDVPGVYRTSPSQWHETGDMLIALALAEEEGGKRKELNRQVEEMLRCPTPKGPRNKPPQLSPSDRLLAALRDVIREMLPEV